jgi:hypothetical protein
VESRYLQGCSPCLCQLRTDELVSTSKYWAHRSHAGNVVPVSLVACHRQKLGLSLLLPWLAWERNWIRTRRLASRCAVNYIRSHFFLRSSGICLNLSVTHKRLLCVDHVRYIWSMAIRRLSVECVWRVGRVSPCRVYIDSNSRDSRIWVPLVYSSQHVDNLTNLMSLSVFDLCCLIHLIICNSGMIRVGCTFLLKWFE